MANLEFDSRALPWLAVVLPFAASAALFLRRRAVAETTMRPPLFWSIAALVGLGGWKVAAVIIAARGGETGMLEPGRFLSGTMTLTPIAAVLGAKRPQDRAWQWIVLTLVIVLWLPCAQHVALNPGGTFEPHAAWRWLIAIFVFAGWLNYAATSFGGAATVAAAGQTLLLAPFLPSPVSAWLDASQGDMGVILLSAAALSLALFRPSLDYDAANPDRAWREFRNLYGAAWSLRVMERFNSPARSLGWPVQLRWSGFRRAGAASETMTNDELSPEMVSNLSSGFRRFMPLDWIATHFRGA